MFAIFTRIITLTNDVLIITECITFLKVLEKKNNSRNHSILTGINTQLY
jgi:hypothetical protein